jgi:hypothetical protein
MSAVRKHIAAACALAIALAPAIAHAQRASDDTDSAARSHTWRDRVGVSARYTTFRPTGHGQFFSLLDDALDPGSGALRPALTTGELRVRVLPRWTVALGMDVGASTVQSFSRAQPGPGSGDVRQQTRLSLSAPYAGAEWEAFQVRGTRLVLEGGGGVMSYRVRQWGHFVDVPRNIEYAADFHSAGRGAMGYLGTAIDAPVRPWADARAELRWRSASARMNRDYATFDRLELGGRSLGAGIVLHRTRTPR